MKVKFNYKETIWFKKPIEIEINDKDWINYFGNNQEEYREDGVLNINHMLNDFIYAHYSTQELIDLSQNQGDPDTEIDILEIKDN
jgi:hypothetical protein